MTTVGASWYFSLKEAAVLSRLPEDRARREVERKVIVPKAAPAGAAHRLLFAEPEVLYFAMLNAFSGDVELSPPTRAKACLLLVEWEPARLLPIPESEKRGPAARRRAWTAIYSDGRFRSEWVERLNEAWSTRINHVLTVNWDALIEEIVPRIDLYRAGLERVHQHDEFLGGEPVFKGTRIAVRHIGGMHAKGEVVERILADYPQLAADDVTFARLFWEAHPQIGRPRSSSANA